MKRRMKKGRDLAIKDKPKSMNMMGKSNEPFAKKAKKPEPDDKPIMKPLAPSSNKNMGKTKSKREKKPLGVML